MAGYDIAGLSVKTALTADTKRHRNSLYKQKV